MAQDPAKPSGSGPAQTPAQRGARPAAKPGTLAAMYEDEVAAAPNRARVPERPTPKTRPSSPTPARLPPGVQPRVPSASGVAPIPKAAPVQSARLPAVGAPKLPGSPSPGAPLSTRQSSVAAAAAPRRSSSISSPASARPVDYCSQCRTSLGRDSEAMGLARRVDDKLICDKCQRANLKQLEAGQTRRHLQVGAGIVILALAVVGIFLPAQLVFLGVIIGVLMTITGALGFTLRGATRVILTGGGLAAVVACTWFLFTFRYQTETSKAHEEYDRVRKEIDGFLEKDDYPSANAKLLVLQSSVRNPRDLDAANALNAAEQSINAWMEKHYHGIDPATRKLMSKLLQAFPFKTASGAQRFVSLQLEDRKARLSFATVWKNPATVTTRNGTVTVSEESLREVADIAYVIFTYLQNAEKVEIEVHAADTGVNLGTYTLTTPTDGQSTALPDLAILFTEAKK